MKKLTNFDFIFVVGETAFENWISCLLKFKKSAKDFDMRVESDPESSSAFTESSLPPQETVRDKTSKYVVVFFFCGFLLILLQLNSGFNKFSIFSKCDTSLRKCSFSMHRSLIKLLLH